MEPIGYAILQHAMRLDRPVKAYERWMQRIPSEYRTAVLGERDLPPSQTQSPMILAAWLCSNIIAA